MNDEKVHGAQEVLAFKYRKHISKLHLHIFYSFDASYGKSLFSKTLLFAVFLPCKQMTDTKRQKLEEARRIIEEDKKSKEQAIIDKRNNVYKELATALGGTLDWVRDPTEVFEYYDSALQYGRDAESLAIAKIDLNETESLISAYSYHNWGRETSNWYIMPRENTFKAVRGGGGEPKYPAESMVSVSSHHFGNVLYGEPDELIEKIIKNQERFTDKQLQLMRTRRVQRAEKIMYTYSQNWK